MSPRLVQVFLSMKPGTQGPAVFEVNADEDKNLICNCPGFVVRKSCKHSRLVQERIAGNHGVYPFKFVTKVGITEIEEAMKSEKTFRDLIIKTTKVEVL